MAAWQFHEDGAAIIHDVIDAPACDRLSMRLPPDGQPGHRQLLQEDWCRQLALRLQAHPALTPLIGSDLIPVQCTFFEKSSQTNWLVPFHQDQSIPVHARVDHPGLSGWSRKDGVWYVQPPLAVLQALVAVRLHLDPCSDQDGPLRVIPGSHRHGRLHADAIGAMKQAGKERGCHMDRGSVLVMSPLLLHASSKAAGQSRRRVLHFLFGPPALPHGLRWSSP